MSWKDSIKDAGTTSWRDSISEAPEVATDPGFFDEGGQFEAGAKGLAQGLTFGFSDEIIAGLRSAFGSDTYEEALKKERTKLAQAEEAHGGTFLAADVVGSLALPVPGASLRTAATVAKGVKAASTTARVAKAATAGALLGGVEAAGRTEEDLLSAEGLKDVAIGAGLGGAVGGVLSGAGAFIRGKADVVDTLTTPGRLKKELQGKVGVKVEDAVEKGKKLGVIKRSPQLSLDATKSKLKSVGGEIETQANKFDELIATKPGAFGVNRKTANILIVNETKVALREISKDVAEGRITLKEGERTVEYIKSNIEKVVNLMDKEEKIFLPTRTVRRGIQDRLKGPDFQPGGVKAGSAKDRVKRASDLIGKIEKEMASGIEGDLLDKISVGNYLKSFDDYSKLKELEGLLIDTLAKSESNSLWSTITAGGIGTIVAGVTGGGSAVGAMALNKWLNTPTGRFMVARGVGGGSKTLKALAKRFNLSEKAILSIIKPSLITGGAAVLDKN